MDKLLKAFASQDNENLKTVAALKVKQYNRKHPMAACMLTPTECVTLNEALSY